MHSPDRENRLSKWLARLEARAPEHRIEPGLERVGRVLQRLPGSVASIPTITVAGTNGKGSVIAFLEATLSAAGRRALAYTSPHLLRFNERIRVAGREAGDDELADALETVESVRGDEALTYFEHITLAAFVVAVRRDVDVLLLEVGLGGRLDAVNVVDADVAVITSIGLDHREWLGATRAAIAGEKLGIARPGRPLVLGEKRWPAAADAALAGTGAEVFRIGRDFHLRASGDGFSVICGDSRRDGLRSGLPGAHQRINAACAVIALGRLPRALRPGPEAIRKGLAQARLRGRFQQLPGRPRVVLDVAHNVAAARVLRDLLAAAPAPSRAVFSALEGKDVRAIGRVLASAFDGWHVAGLSGVRGRTGEAIAADLRGAAVHAPVEALESVGQALDRALAASERDDRVVVFGSFQTVAAAWHHLQDRHLSNSDEANG